MIVAAGTYAGQNRTVFAGTVEEYGETPKNLKLSDLGVIASFSKHVLTQF